MAVVRRGGERTRALIWGLGILCGGFAVAVILTAALVFGIYLAYEPRSPSLRVSAAHLDLLDYDQAGLLTTQLSLTLLAENPNKRAHATFSKLELAIRLLDVSSDQEDLALLRADYLTVQKNGSSPLSYVARSQELPLDQAGRDSLDASIKSGTIGFHLRGHARTSCRIGVYASLNLSIHLSCALTFGVLNGTALALHCDSNSR